MDKHRLATRPWATTGIALLGTGVFAVVTPLAAPPPAAAVGTDIQLTATDITLDLVRHGQSTDDLNGILGTMPPGAHLTDLGEQQAAQVAQDIQQEFPGGIAGIYASELVRTQETMQALAALPGMPDVTVLSDLNEIPAGLFEGHPRDLITEANFFLPMASWILGNLLVSEPGTNYNGVVFEDQVNQAVQTMYDNTIADPSGATTAVASSSGGDIAIWILMNVKNPDIWPILQTVLENGGPPPNAGEAILEGNPTDGWTLVSWDGIAVPANPDLITGLLVDVRNVITAPQIALWHLWEAIQGGDQADITAAWQTGFNDVIAAYEAFPQSVMDTITGAFAGSAGGAADSVADGLLGAI
ncbi:phosphoglycerate mutase family protein [Mycolicibacter terrae]|uniref:Phosphoglycerate mutase n=2 Tax=Mycolicibacter TaxID=1073531 RepID=A0A1A2XKJ4_MYCSD|nr:MULTISPECIES: phosphoglycerate mutase family protein [Mycolicibacter]OBH15391.1 phosphoglycerate mutase [Mycolicibacter sinensis]OBI25421.1 phosphoglycerate mutase [Mycolicibacter sinensis]RRR44718.1 phosphoglycerate mutase family protein [Mycolicibacter terrae]